MLSFHKYGPKEWWGWLKVVRISYFFICFLFLYIIIWNTVQIVRGKTYWDVIVDKILEGKYLYDDLFKKIIHRSMKNPEIKKETNQNMTDLQRVIVLQKYFPSKEFIKLVHKLDLPLLKNEAIARILNRRGDKHYKKGVLESALTCYTLAISYGTNTGKCLAAAYAGRSALFLRILLVPLAFEDINMGLVFPSSAKVFDKLNRQKMVCLNLSETMINTRDDGRNPEFKKYVNDVIFQIYDTPHPKMASAAKCVAMRWSLAKGRNLITTEDLEPGTTVIVEHPYVSAIDNSLKWEMKHCFMCYKRIWQTFPCKKCVFAIYCDEKCQTQDFDNGHKYLCPCIPYLHSLKAHIYEYLSIKAVCRAGPTYIYNIYKESQLRENRVKSRSRKSRDETKQLSGFHPETGLYSSDSYYQIMNLISHPENNDNMNFFAWKAVSFAQILSMQSDFFTEIKKCDRKGFFDLVASLFLQHIVSFPYNGVALRKPHCENQLEFIRINQSEDSDGITGIFSLISTMNHSCEPTIIWEQAPDGRLAIITRQKLKAGEELFFSYGYNYSACTLKNRKDPLRKNYLFECKCIACTYDWPLNEDIEPELKFMCRNCIQEDYNRLFLMKHCELNIRGSKAICGYCDSKFYIEDLMYEAEGYEKLLIASGKLIANRHFLQAIHNVKECILYYQSNIKSPSIDLLQAQELLWTIYEKLIQL